MNFSQTSCNFKSRDQLIFKHELNQKRYIAEKCNSRNCESHNGRISYKYDNTVSDIVRYFGCRNRGKCYKARGSKLRKTSH